LQRSKFPKDLPMLKKINSALISVYHKAGLENVIELLKDLGVTIYSTGGTAKFIEEQGVQVQQVENLTSYPSILGGRVKTLHPKVFGGILARRHDKGDVAQLDEYEIPQIDLVIVDLYPFEETVVSTNDEAAIIEKIDIGGIALIRATAKNYKDTLIVSHQSQYQNFVELLKEKQGFSDIEDRQQYAKDAFNVSSHYDTAIYKFFNGNEEDLSFKQSSFQNGNTLRYGENPHQQAVYYGDLSQMLNQLSGKQISYNNLVDMDAAVNIIAEFNEPTVAVLKHTNTCGLATRATLIDAWKDALVADPISAFGGVLITNQTIDLVTAHEIDKLFYEVLIAPKFNDDALELLKQKKNRILCEQVSKKLPNKIYKNVLNGVVEQQRDNATETEEDLKTATTKSPTDQEVKDLLFANKVVKHLKSNGIALVRNGQLLGMGCGQTSRVDALNQAINKAKRFGFDVAGSVMASEAFFPFPDCVEIAKQSGINAVIQPGGSKKDQDSIDYCNANNMSMVFTGTRHFKH